MKALAIFTVAANFCFAGEAQNPSARVFSHSANDGNTIYAVSVKPETTVKPTALQRDVVILVDTSASQVGVHRNQSLAVLKSLLASLSKADRVQILSVDSVVKAYTTEFVSAQSEQARQAFADIQMRVPAGATDLPKALNETLAKFQESQRGAIVYIGDGHSNLNFVDVTKIESMTKSLYDRKIAFHAYAVGPQVDAQVLGILAVRSGGYMMLDRSSKKNDIPSVVGRKLASAVKQPIIYPKSFATDSKRFELSPNVPLPLRYDRETIYLGKSSDNRPFRMTFQLDEKKSLVFDVRPEQSQKNHRYLPALWNRAKDSQGLSVAFAGENLLNIAHEDFNSSIKRLALAGTKAMFDRDYRQAERIALQIQRFDSGNVQAKALLKSARNPKTHQVSFLKNANVPSKGLTNQDVKGSGQKTKTQPKGKKQNLAQKAAKDRELVLQKLKVGVDQILRQARQFRDTDPDVVRNALKEHLNTVQSTTDINPESRAQLIRRLRRAIQDFENLILAKRQEDVAIAEKRANLEALERLEELMHQDEKKVELLVDQVLAFIIEGYRGDDDAFERAEAVARQVESIRPLSSIAAQVVFTSEASGHLNKAFRLRSLRADRFLETLHQVELSHVPFPDEPPIRWPAPEVWAALTEGRKKWRDVSLTDPSPNVAKIIEALDKETDIDFTQNTLGDVIDVLSDQHDIQIILDKKELDILSIDRSTAVDDVSLKGISLKSALKIILEPMELSYIIEDEVMKITSLEKANETFETRVYAVGDLVVPIINQGGGGIGGGGGGFGGGGGGFGGGGQGGGGFGGGGQGGGGFFNVPPGKIQGKPQQNRNNRFPVRQKNIDNKLNDVVDNIIGLRNVPQGQAFASISDLDGKKK